ncbi:atherin-like [Onychomys torridus]|uniref:atherin-like n=1 Tax=Onychomys torridus TaxID=38674 RepID=UPI00167F4091|nr:atherin-like [Onychomys torridus]
MDISPCVFQLLRCEMGQTRSLSKKEERPSPCVLPTRGNGAQTGNQPVRVGLLVPVPGAHEQSAGSVIPLSAQTPQVQGHGLQPSRTHRNHAELGERLPQSRAHLGAPALGDQGAAGARRARSSGPGGRRKFPPRRPVAAQPRGRSPAALPAAGTAQPVLTRPRLDPQVAVGARREDSAAARGTGGGDACSPRSRATTALAGRAARGLYRRRRRRPFLPPPPPARPAPPSRRRRLCVAAGRSVPPPQGTPGRPPRRTRGGRMLPPRGGVRCPGPQKAPARRARPEVRRQPGVELHVGRPDGGWKSKVKELILPPGERLERWLRD